MEIREMRAGELDRLKAMTVEAFDGVSIDQAIEQHFGVVGGHDWRWRKARHLDDDLVRDPNGIFVLDDAGSIAGYISTWCDRRTSIGHIPNLVIDAPYRNQGLGRRLIEHALAHFRRQGMTHAKIETLVQNEVGKHLYTSAGFHEVARQVHFVAPL
jgi:ribosomal protein S18 acetylase RimI-like enzyme